MIKTENKIDVFNDGISYISSVDMSNANKSQEDREYFSQLATITRNKLESKNTKQLFNRLLTEASSNKPSRPIEFIPIKLYIDFWNNSILLKDMNGEVIEMIETIDAKIHFYNTLIPFSYIETHEEYSILYTNLRALINYGMDYDVIPLNNDCNSFKCVVGKIPAFVYSHLVTHTQLSTESSSIRINGNKNIDMWYPKGDISAILKLQDLNVFNTVLNLKESDDYKYELGLRDVSSRRYVSFVMTGWLNNPNSWNNLFNERGANEWKNWTQQETKQVVKSIKQVIC